MLQFVTDLEPHVVGIHAVGEVTKQDIDTVLIPALDDLVARQGEINYLLILETDIQNWTMGAWIEDLKTGIKNITKWNRIAVVSDQKGVEWFTNAFRIFIPGESKGFPLNELNEAIAWVTATNNK